MPLTPEDAEKAAKLAEKLLKISPEEAKLAAKVADKLFDELLGPSLKAAVKKTEPINQVAGIIGDAPLTKLQPTYDGIKPSFGPGSFQKPPPPPPEEPSVGRIVHFRVALPEGEVFEWPAMILNVYEDNTVDLVCFAARPKENAFAPSEDAIKSGTNFGLLNADVVWQARRSPSDDNAWHYWQECLDYPKLKTGPPSIVAKSAMASSPLTALPPQPEVAAWPTPYCGKCGYAKGLHPNHDWKPKHPNSAITCAVEGCKSKKLEHHKFEPEKSDDDDDDDDEKYAGLGALFG